MKPQATIPFLDLVTPHKELEEQLVAVFRQSLRTAGFVGGPMLDQFEKRFAAFCEAKHSVGVNSGTDALRFALMCAGIEQNDIVITVANTFIATTEAISQAGGVPDFVDIDPATYTMDPRKLAEYLTNKCWRDEQSQTLVHRESGRMVRAVVPVHLYGQPADMDPIMELAEQYGLLVIEDACQAHGASYYSAKHKRWMKAGSIGKAAAFSFYPGKNLGACGEAGAVTTNDDTVAKGVRMLRDHGQAKKYYHTVEGYNGRLDTIQAGILDVKLAYLEQWNEQRRNAAERYMTMLQEIDGIELPVEPDWAKSVYHLYVVQVDNRDELRESLEQSGIGTGIHYPIPLHLQDAYANMGFSAGDLPVTERVCSRIVSLPMFPQLTSAQQERVAEELRAAIQPKQLRAAGSAA